MVVSLLPANYHPSIAEACIETGVNMTTASYISPKMRKLAEPAEKAGVVIINECGVDPGIDHMSAMRVIDNVRKRGGRIISFMSYCGGLPAPDANDNPFGYKFSWAPRGVLSAGKQHGRYLRDGEEIFIPGNELFSHYWTLDIPPIGKLEAYPNRNSLEYLDTYSLTNAHTMFRGTLRYPRWCDTMKAIADIGYLDETEYDFQGKTYWDLAASFAGNCDSECARSGIAGKLGISVDSDILNRLEWLGLFSNEPLPNERGAPIDVLTARMEEKMPYKTGERDMIVMKHFFRAEFPNGAIEEITSTLIDYGNIETGDSSMSRTVSLPLAAATKMVLEGAFNQPGVHIPVIPELYQPILSELETLGIKCVEETSSSNCSLNYR